MSDKLDRFIKAQQQDFKAALEEIRNGKKETHWMWYIFPQIKGLGMTETSKYYGIESLEEAVEYWNNEYLRSNLLEITNALLSLEGLGAYEIFGDPDMLKLKSCVTLFYIATNEPIFEKIIQKYFFGHFDNKTVRILGMEKQWKAKVI